MIANWEIITMSFPSHGTQCSQCSEFQTHKAESVYGNYGKLRKNQFIAFQKPYLLLIPSYLIKIHIIPGH